MEMVANGYQQTPFENGNAILQLQHQEVPYEYLGGKAKDTQRSPANQ